MEIVLQNPNVKSVVIDPSSAHYCGNRLFDLADSKLNRDGTLEPFSRAQMALRKAGVEINTVDLLLHGKIAEEHNQYYSLGMLSNIPALDTRTDIEFMGFLIMEPPIVAPELYGALPELTDRFEYVYVHNTLGDGYSLEGVDQSKLRKLYWPQPHKGVMPEYWCNTNREKRIVVINGNHKPKLRAAELYSKRIEAMASLATLGIVDLYGRGWAKWWSRSSMWLPYWLNRKTLMSIYQGECESKYAVLSHYQFCLCFENMEMQGYVTEKIFDCLYSGTIPLYWGAPDIEALIPCEAYVDARKYSSWQEMWEAVEGMTDAEVNTMREAGRLYLDSSEFIKYYNSIADILGKGIKFA